MVKSIVKAGVMLAAVAFPLSAQAYTMSDIDGNYQCVIQSFDGDYFGEYTYVINSNGTGQLSGYIELLDSGSYIYMDFTSEMKLRVSGSIFYEGSTKATIHEMEIDDSPVPYELRQAMEEGMVAEGEAPNNIRYVDSNVLVLSDNSNVSTCVKP